MDNWRHMSLASYIIIIIVPIHSHIFLAALANPILVVYVVIYGA
jgi:hypothetical protein